MGAPPVTVPPPPPPVFVMPTAPPRPADPYNCADGFAFGWLDGLWARRHGAAEFTGRGALQQLVVVRPQRHTIAMQDLPIGWLVGVWPKRRFAASMAVKGAHLRQADVHRVSVRSATD